MASTTLAAGRLRHRVRIQNLVSERDSEGVIQHEWVALATVWASVEPISGREFIQSGATQSEVTARITIRHRDDVVANMRIVHRGRVYNIKGVLSDKESGLEYLTLPVSEGVSDGQ
jgi:SPP1 family predicted phage head-tail adaptor